LVRTAVTLGVDVTTEVSVFEALVVNVAEPLEEPPPTVPVVVVIWACIPGHTAAAAVNHTKRADDLMYPGVRRFQYILDSGVSMPLNLLLERIRSPFTGVGLRVLVRKRRWERPKVRYTAFYMRNRAVPVFS
jgi:hypothetical protein